MAEATTPINTSIALYMLSPITTHKPLVFELFLSMMSECQCVGTATVCNESTAQTLLSCSVSEETKRGSTGLCKN
jgi:hypothetical protein